MFANFQVESASVLTLTIPAVLRRNVLPLEDDSEVVADNTPTTKFVPDAFVYFLARRAHYLQRCIVQMSNPETVGRLTLHRGPKGNYSDVRRLHLLPVNQQTSN